MKRARAEKVGWTFSAYGRGLDSAADMDLPDPSSVPVDTQLLVDEARIGCSSAVLLCLDISCGRAARVDPAEIVSLERGALDRWGRGDPQGYLEIMADDLTCFDPTQERRVDGLEAMGKLLAPFAVKIHIDRYEMINPKVQQAGDVATLTFNLVNYQKKADGSERVLNRWNSTELYRRTNGAWKLIHSHWSYVKPDVNMPTPRPTFPLLRPTRLRSCWQWRSGHGSGATTAPSRRRGAKSSGRVPDPRR